MSECDSNSVLPFPTDVPIAALHRLDLQKLFSNDPVESKNLFEACRTSGFFLLDLQNSERGQDLLKKANEIFSLSKKLLDMDPDSKTKYATKPGSTVGYKGIGVGKVDSRGTPDRCEFWGISKDSILENSLQEEFPLSKVSLDSRKRLATFTEHAHSVCMLVLDHIEQNLKLESSSLTSLHNLHEASLDLVRLLRVPPQPADDRRTSLLAHTDIGSVTLLWNVLGGLQIQNAEAQNDEGWEFVRPEPGCCIVNIGDALAKLTSDVIRSNLHRVISAPGEQANQDRYSIAYFCRPTDDVPMKAIPLGINLEADKSGDIKYAIETGDKTYTAKEWVGLKAKLYREGGEPMRSHGGKAEVAIG